MPFIQELVKMRPVDPENGLVPGTRPHMPSGKSRITSTNGKPRRKRPPREGPRVQRGGPAQLRWRLDLDTPSTSKTVTIRSSSSTSSDEEASSPKSQPSSKSAPTSFTPRPLAPLTIHIGNNAGDPFSTTAIPVNHFIQHLLPLAKRSYVYDHLNQVLPSRGNPGDQWISGMLAHNTHAAYLFGYGLGRRIPHTYAPKDTHLQTHMVAALSQMRQAVNTNKWSSRLAELNTMLAAHAFYNGRVDEWISHTLACREMVEKMGGVDKVDPLLRGVILVSGAVACNRVLFHPTFSSSDFDLDIPPLDEDSRLEAYNSDHMPLPASITNVHLLSLFDAHREYHSVFSLYHDQPSKAAAQLWIDRRFHQLNIHSLEVYFKAYKANPINLDEGDRIQAQINGILTLALSYLHQYIYHSVRRVGDTDISSLFSPFPTISFFHLRTHLRRLFEFETYDVMVDYEPILWATFVLMINENMKMKTNEILGLPNTEEDEWGTVAFHGILHRLRAKQRSYEKVKLLLKSWLYHESFDGFLKAALADNDDKR
jgi:hypothetical protein